MLHVLLGVWVWGRAVQKNAVGFFQFQAEGLTI